MPIVDLGSVLITCSHCHHMTSQQVVAGYENLVEDVFNHEGRRVTFERRPTYRLSQCPACDRFNLSVTSDDDSDDLAILWPTPDKSLSGLPMEIDTAYNAALNVKNIDSNAFGGLTRRLLEMVCIERGAVGHTLLAIG